MKSKITFIPHSICAPIGFTSSAVAANIRKSGKLDLGLICSQVPAVAAGVFTKNKVKAAPLVLTKKNIKDGLLQAIIINSGNANACTGKVGDLHAKQMIAKVAEGLNIDANLVGVASTGVIGVTMPIDKITNKIPSLVDSLSADANNKTAHAIMTTDTFVKEAAVEIQLNNSSIRIGGIAKGSGMIHPNMATMLAFVTTDADIEHKVLKDALRNATNQSFNMISVDGDSSTNDMVLVMANKMAKNTPIKSLNSEDGKIFYAGLVELMILLAKKIAQDGEGATKLIEVTVIGAKSPKQAKNVAKSVVSSTLVKAAIFGNDANWGRIACAVGYADNQINPNKMQISLGNLKLFANGLPLAFSEEDALNLLQQKTVNINIDLCLGNSHSMAWGCDLSYDYVKINAAYRT
ncbi:MAG: bifunctional glutamate N-acetyltransferase/amino-acid acetyltransferase ArgJ [Neisseriaceae bacterium]